MAYFVSCVLTRTWLYLISHRLKSSVRSSVTFSVKYVSCFIYTDKWLKLKDGPSIKYFENEKGKMEM